MTKRLIITVLVGILSNLNFIRYSRDINGYNHFRKQFLVPTKAEHIFILWTSSSIFKYIPNRNTYLCVDTKNL